MNNYSTYLQYIIEDLKKWPINDIIVYAKLNNIDTKTIDEIIKNSAKNILISHVPIKLVAGKINHDQRLNLAKDIEENKINVHKCDIDKYLTIKKKIKSGSSHSKIRLGVIDALNNPNIDILMKISRVPESNEDTDEIGSEYEYFIYKYFVTYILENDISPNFPYYYGSLVCDYKQIESRYIFIEGMHGDVLSNYLMKSITLTNWKSTLFQILYNLHCLHLLGINHNDNHPNNIYVEMFDIDNNIIKDTITYFLSPTEYYTIPINMNLIKIFDFDLSSVDCDYVLKNNPSAKIKDIILKFKEELGKDTCNNVKIDNEYFNRIGLVNKNTPPFDVYILMCYLWKLDSHLHMPKEVRSFIKDIYKIDDKNNPLTIDLEFVCRAPNIKNDPVFKDADGNPRYKTIPEILNMKFFDEFRNTQISDNVFKLPNLLIDNEYFYFGSEK